MGSDTEWSKVRRGKERRVGVRKFHLSIKGTERLQDSSFSWGSKNKKNWAEYACTVGKCSGLDVGEDNDNKKE